MKSKLYHLQINVDFKSNSKFYKEFMTFMGWEIIFEADDMVGFKTQDSSDIWFIDAQKKEQTDYDKIGVNHLALRVEKESEVNDTIKFLEGYGIKTLFGTPRHRPEFAASENETYYQIIFETPDKIQVEVVYIGPR